MQLENIWSQYRSALKAFLHARVSNAADVDDLLQEILIKTHRKLTTLEQAQSVKAWLFQIANHTLIDFYRQRKSLDEYSVETLLYKEDEYNIKHDLSRCIEPFLNALDQEQADLIRAIDLQGLTQKDHAEHLGLSYSTLKSRVQKSRQSLFALFDECCHYSLDKQGNLIDYDAKNDHCHHC